MSPRAAWRLEALGFGNVYDYVPGKTDWLSHGLASEGTAAGRLTAGDVARCDVPTCGLEERLADVQRRVVEAGWDTCIVVNEEKVVLGRLGRKALALEDDGVVEDFMSDGPNTIRPRLPLETIVERLRERDITTAIVTLPNGRLVGVVRRPDAERLLA